MDSRTLGLALIGLGLAATFLGSWSFKALSPGSDGFPGDIRIEWEHVCIYAPLASMLLLSLALTLLLNLTRRLF